MHKITSVVQLLRKGVKFNTTLETGMVARYNGKAVYEASIQNDFFILQTLLTDMAHAANTLTANAATDMVPIRFTIGSKRILLWHARLGHLVLPAIKHIVAKKAANGIETHTRSPAYVCEACIILGKLY